MSFARAVSLASEAIGSPFGVALNLATVATGVPVGAAMHWSAGWQLWWGIWMSLDAIVMAVLIQAAQVAAARTAKARDDAMHAKLNSLVVAVPDADSDLAGCEAT